MEITDKHFCDWEGSTFGYGYGDGEYHIIPCLAKFFELLEDERSYDYQKLEKEFGSLAAWLLINILCRADIIEYGTSPRFAWISPKGELLRDYFKGKDPEKIYHMVMDRDPSTDHPCYKEHCNCETPCNNPLFK